MLRVLLSLEEELEGGFLATESGRECAELQSLEGSFLASESGREGAELWSLEADLGGGFLASESWIG